MFKFLRDQENLRRIAIITISGIFIVAFYVLMIHFSEILDALQNLLLVLLPFIFGLALAYLLSLPADRLSEKLPHKWTERHREIIASLSVIGLFLVAVIVFIVILIPQLIVSIKQLIAIFENFSRANSFFDKFVQGNYLNKELIKQFSGIMGDSTKAFIAYLQAQVPGFIGATLNGVKMLGDAIIGIIVALYILLDKRNLKRQFRKASLAFLSEKQYLHMSGIIRLSAAKFGNFFNGKILDSFIIGIICFIAMLILRLDYAVLISFVIGVTNIIPFFGPFIGAIPCSFILLIVNPLQAFWFVIMIIILQQIDGNVIGPRILGDSVGLSSLWIMFAIIVGGAYFGVAGMILGVPVLAVFYFLFADFVNARLIKKGIYTKEK